MGGGSGFRLSHSHKQARLHIGSGLGLRVWGLAAERQGFTPLGLQIWGCRM